MSMKRIMYVILVLLGFGVAIAAGYVWGQRNAPKSVVFDFASCVNAGYAVMESSPRQCRTPDGATFTEKTSATKPDSAQSTPVLKTREFTSEKGVVIRLYDWVKKPVLSSPVTIKGETPGNWSFEASFPVVLTDWDGRIIAEEPATLLGEWMTEEYVPFNVTLDFETDEANKNGSLILRKDNPSGLSENDDAVEIPISYK